MRKTPKTRQKAAKTMFFAVWGGFQAQKRRRATTVQDAGALAGDHRTARSVVDCASSGALGGRETISAERELSQLAAGGMTSDGWDDFDGCFTGHALRIGDNPRSGGQGVRLPDLAGFADNWETRKTPKTRTAPRNLREFSRLPSLPGANLRP